MLKTATRIRVGGLKILEEGACVVSSSSGGENRLSTKVCAPLALQKINLTLLAHAAGEPGRDSNTVFCTAGKAGPASTSLLSPRHRNPGSLNLRPDTCILSLYPHDRRPEITGNFILSLARAKVPIHGLASSPAAISGVLPSADKDMAVQSLFQHFHFPAYRSPREFYAAQRPPDEVVREVVASYQEKVIKIYCIGQQSDLDLWELRLTPAALPDFADAVTAMGAGGWKMPFLVAVPVSGEELLFSFTLAKDLADEVGGILNSHLPGINARRHSPVAVISIHGPHFGDRYGIADTLVAALERGRVSLLAISCAVSSISTIVSQADLAPAVQILGETFEVPMECWREP